MMPTLRILKGCEGKPLRHFIEKVDVDILNVWDGETRVELDDLPDYLDRKVDYVDVWRPEGWWTAHVHLREVRA